MSELKNGKFYHGDCLEIMKNIPNESVNMVLTDLPYGTTQNKWDSIIPLEPLWKELLRVGKQNAIFAFTASQPFTSMLVISNLKMFKHEWIWIKNRGSNFANTVREPMKEHESILIFSRGKWTYNKQMQERTISGKSRINYDVKCSNKSENYGKNWKGIVQKGKGGKSNNYGKFEGKDIILSELRVPSSWQKFNTSTEGLHPTQKPVPLFEYLIKTYTNEGDIVLDCCAGSGTTAIAAINTNRKWICIEKDENYYDKAIKRIKNHLPLNEFIK